MLFAFYNTIGNGIQISDSYVLNNNASVNTLTILYSLVNITNSLFQDNFSKYVSHGLTGFKSTIIMDKTIVNYTKPDTTLASSLADYGFFNLNYQSTL